MSPLFSVVIPTHNRSGMLPTALASVFGQQFQDFEVVVVDDASTDDTSHVLASYHDPRLTAIRNEHNLHKGGARNVGIEAARGQYVCFLDDDDYYLPTHLAVHAAEIRARSLPEALFFTLAATQVLGQTDRVTLDLPPISVHPVAYLFDVKHPVTTPQACVHARILREIKFNPAIRTGQDTELFMRIATRFPVIRIPTVTFVLVRHHRSSGDLSNNTGRERLDGLRFVFSNPELRRHIGWRLRGEVYAYSYTRIAEFHLRRGERRKGWVALVIAIASAPWDGHLLPRIVSLLYSLPGGALVRRVVGAVTLRRSGPLTSRTPRKNRAPDPGP